MTLSFTTSRLNVFEISSNIPQSDIQHLLSSIPTLLTPNVVKNLPAYFHGIESQADALIWLKKLMSESRLFAVSLQGLDQTIGFLFAYIENSGDVHIGYLLGEEYWGQGLASELLQGFIDQTTLKENWISLIAGVEISNHASLKLLLKLGFIEYSVGEGGVVFYKYTLPQQ